MFTNFREQVGMPKLSQYWGVDKLSDLDTRKFRAVCNIKRCAELEYANVYSYRDHGNLDVRDYMLNARGLFDSIYKDSQENIYHSNGEFVSGGKALMTELRFCGKRFLQEACLYFTAKLMEETFYEVDGKQEDYDRIVRELQEIKSNIN